MYARTDGMHTSEIRISAQHRCVGVVLVGSGYDGGFGEGGERVGGWVGE